jgi:ketosteroid isomerase-like protein
MSPKTQTSEAELNVSIAKEYFRRADAGRADLLDLMTEDLELYFPKFGVARGRKAFAEMAAGMGGAFEWVEHDFSTYNFISTGSYVIVEGTTRGALKNGKSWKGGETPGGRFCNVFEFKNGLISRVYVYLDPDYTSDDAERFRWGRDGRAW